MFNQVKLLFSFIGFIAQIFLILGSFFSTLWLPKVVVQHEESRFNYWRRRQRVLWRNITGRISPCSLWILIWRQIVSRRSRGDERSAEEIYIILEHRCSSLNIFIHFFFVIQFIHICTFALSSTVLFRAVPSASSGCIKDILLHLNNRFSFSAIQGRGGKYFLMLGEKDFLLVVFFSCDTFCATRNKGRKKED